MGNTLIPALFDPETIRKVIEHFTPQLGCWDTRAKKHDVRVMMAGEDSETSRHRAEELRRCSGEIKQLLGLDLDKLEKAALGIKDPPPEPAAQAESDHIKEDQPAPAPSAPPPPTTLDVQGIPPDSQKT